MILFIQIMLLWASIANVPVADSRGLPKPLPPRAIVINTGALQTDNYWLFVLYQDSDEIKVIRGKLDDLTKMLQGDPQYDAWILSYGGKRTCAAEAKQRAESAKEYLVDKGISPQRIVVLDAGFHEEWVVELWLVIHGTPGPTPNPSVKPETVRIINRTKRQRYKCHKLKI